MTSKRFQRNQNYHKHHGQHRIIDYIKHNQWIFYSFYWNSYLFFLFSQFVFIQLKDGFFRTKTQGTHKKSINLPATKIFDGLACDHLDASIYVDYLVGVFYSLIPQVVCTVWHKFDGSSNGCNARKKKKQPKNHRQKHSIKSQRKKNRNEQI